MNIDEIVSLKGDFDKIKNHFSIYPSTFRKYKEKNPTTEANKYDNEFSTDDDFSISGTHTISFKCCVGYHGCDSYYTKDTLNRSNYTRFWKGFDNYINLHREEIFQHIASYMQEELKGNIDILDREMDKLKDIRQQLSVENENESIKA